MQYNTENNKEVNLEIPQRREKTVNRKLNQKSRKDEKKG